MVSFFITLFRFGRALRHGLREPEFRALFVVVLITLASGVIFYSTIEGWSVIDSLYFSVITLTTVGYGDLHPTSAASKIFTVFYLLVGVGIIATFVQRLAAHSLRRRTDPAPTAETAKAGEGEEEATIS